MSYRAFWRGYLRAHADPRTRALHYLGTVLALAMLAIGAGAQDWRAFLAAPAVGYGFAWLGHLAFEGNRPQSFGHPLWSLACDLRMLGLFATGRLRGELQVAGSVRGRPK